DKEAEAGIKIVAKLKDGTLTRESIRKQLEDPNRNLELLKKEGGKLKATKTRFAEAIAQLDKNDVPGVPGDKGVAPKVPERPDLSQLQREQMILEEQKMTQTVEAGIREARSLLQRDPDAALEVLTNTLTRVRDNPEIGDRVRLNLIDRLQSQLRDTAVTGKVLKQRKEEDQRLVAQVANEKNRDVARRQAEERVEAQFKVFRGLMNLARVEEKTKQDLIQGMRAIAAEARLKGEPVPTTARAMYDQVLASYHLQKNAELRELRAERFIAVLLEVEKSHVPFPDEPAIHFPPLVMWQAITKTRKEKYEIQSLPDDPEGRAEANNISKMLGEKVDMRDF